MRVGIVTLGCDKNTVDNEYLAGLLDEAGCELVPATPDGGLAGALDAVVITTCGFIDRAKEQSIETIMQLAAAKRERGNPRRVFVAGCLSQRYADDLMREIPEIDGLVGVGQFSRMARMILEADARDKQAAGVADVAATPTVDIYKLMRRKKLDATPYAFLKVSDGCNHTCTFCSIPLMKGKLRSVAPEIVLEEARALLAQGVKEINLVAQDLSMYGMDLEGDTRLPDLIRQICALPGDFWVRCLYYYPGLVTDDFLDVLADEPKVVKYVDMPLQHLDPEVLRRMKRPFHAVKTFDLVERMRRRVPGLALRTTMICGFPGETASQHRNMVEGVGRLRFERMGAFQYSVEDSTPAGSMEDQVSPLEREKRWHAVMRAQAPIARAHSEARVGRTERVLLDSWNPERKAWAARSSAEAPEIDGNVFVLGDNGLKAGEFVNVKITGAEDYDVVAQLV